jgi:hypothetical protein
MLESTVVNTVAWRQGCGMWNVECGMIVLQYEFRVLYCTALQLYKGQDVICTPDVIYRICVLIAFDVISRP